jgi:hypothetical protein
LQLAYLAVADFRLMLRDLRTGVSIPTGECHKITIVRGVSRVRLVGMFFDLNKCFLLPSAMRGIRKIKALYDDHPGANLLCVGHTDTSGNDEYNLTLSLERADAVAAYLTDKVDVWEACFEQGKPQQKRWGTLEVQHMLSVLPERQPPFYEGRANGRDDAKHRAAVQKFQESKTLTVDGIAGPLTRSALIKAYMGLDGTTLPGGTTLTTHGCGENFPIDATGEKVRDTENRRVEVFLFDGPVTPLPGKTSARGSKEYPQWLAQVSETVDFSADDVNATSLVIRFHDQAAMPLTNVRFRVIITGAPEVSGLSPDGFATVPLPSFCPANVKVEWSGPGHDSEFMFSRDIVVDCEEGTLQQQAMSKLTNLGYLSETADEFEAATRAFQADYGIAEDGLVGGEMPPLTRARLDSIYATALDATRPDLTLAADSQVNDGEPPSITSSMGCAL